MRFEHPVTAAALIGLASAACGNTYDSRYAPRYTEQVSYPVNVYPSVGYAPSPVVEVVRPQPLVAAPVPTTPTEIPSAAPAASVHYETLEENPRLRSPTSLEQDQDALRRKVQKATEEATKSF